MKQLPLGKTGLEVSALCLGGIGFGTKLDRDASYRLLDQYYEAGGRFFDSANIYSRFHEGFSGGESETVIGEWVRDRRNRSDIVLVSKLGFPYEDVEQGLKSSQIQEECEKSLSRLQTDYIDLYYAHGDDRDTPYEETLRAFDSLVKSGKVRHLGASNFEAWRLAESQMVSQTNGWTEYCVLQQRHTYLRPNPDAQFGSQVWLKPEMIDYCRTKSLTILAYSTTLSGAYSTREDRGIPDAYGSSVNEARLAVLAKVVEETGATPIQVILAWMLQSDPPILPLCGASKVEQLEEKLSALNLTLSEDQMDRLGH